VGSAVQCDSVRGVPAGWGSILSLVFHSSCPFTRKHPAGGHSDGALVSGYVTNFIVLIGAGITLCRKYSLIYHTRVTEMSLFLPSILSTRLRGQVAPMPYVRLALFSGIRCVKALVTVTYRTSKQPNVSHSDRAGTGGGETRIEALIDREEVEKMGVL